MLPTFQNNLPSQSNFTVPSSSPKFIPAANNHEYKSYDGKRVNIGDKVYQISFVEGTYTPVLFEFEVRQLLNDGRVTLVGKFNNVTKDVQVHPRNVHTNAMELLEYWLYTISHKLLVELPETKVGLENEIKKIKPDYDFTKIQIGELKSGDESEILI